MKIRNKQLEATVVPFGAELQSVVDSSNKHEYIWQANPDVWPRHAPVLFPIVGRLKEDTYSIGEAKYNLNQHGFARNSDFSPVKWNESEVIFKLSESDETASQYPYKFDFHVGYRLEERSLFMTFEVTNHDDRPMPVSYGAHPAFNTKPVDGYVLRFEKEEYALSQAVVNGIRDTSERAFFEGNMIRLSKSIFDYDALIFENLKSSYVDIMNRQGKTEVRVHIKSFPYLGIWAKPGADYVCIEPWCGIADKQSHNGQIFEKEGVMVLQPEQKISHEMRIDFPAS